MNRIIVNITISILIGQMLNKYQIQGFDLYFMVFLIMFFAMSWAPFLRAFKELGVRKERKN